MTRISAFFLAIAINAAIAGPLEDADLAIQKKDYDTAARLVFPLAQQGNTQAQMLLARLYEAGWGVQQDSIEAGKWYRRAAEQNDLDAMWLVSFLYERGRLGLPKDSVEARKWLVRAAEQGHMAAQGVLARAYETGESGLKDSNEAGKWYSRAAMQGDSGAQFSLGILYENGNGVRQDYVLAHMWFNLAASTPTPKGNFDPLTDTMIQAGVIWTRQMSADLRDRLAIKMTPAQIAEAQSLAREWRAKPERARHITAD